MAIPLRSPYFETDGWIALSVKTKLSRGTPALLGFAVSFEVGSLARTNLLILLLPGRYCYRDERPEIAV
jgi:hypothetical protein